MKRTLIALAIFAALITGCTGHRSLLISSRMEDASALNDTRRFTMIYFFGINQFDPRRAVVLDLEDDDIQIAPNVRDFEYEKLQNVSINEALYEAEVFFASEPKIINSIVSTISTPDGSFVGYEVLPLYDRSYLGRSELLDVIYSLGPDETILFDVELKRGIPKPY